MAKELAKIATALCVFVAMVAVYMAMADSTSAFVAVLWLLSPVFGYYVGAMKGAQDGGLVLGLLLGPFGVVAAGLLDNRPMCPRCGGRSNGTVERPFSVCQHCQYEYTAKGGFPSTQAATIHRQENEQSDPESDWERKLDDAAKQLVDAGLAPGDAYCDRDDDW